MKQRISYTTKKNPLNALFGGKERTFYINYLDSEKTDRLVRRTDLREILLDEKTVPKKEMARIVSIATDRGFFMPSGLLAWYLEKKLDEKTLKKLCLIVGTRIAPKHWQQPLTFETAIYISKYTYFDLGKQ